MRLTTLLARLLGHPEPSPPSPGPAPAAAPASPLEPAIAAAAPSPLAPRRRRLTPTGWRRVLVDTGALHYARRDSRREARFAVLAEAAGLSLNDFVREVEARHAQALRRDDRGRRPMEVESFAARLRALASADPAAAARLADVQLRGDEAERRAKAAHRRKAATDKAVAARGMAAVLAAGALVGATIDAPADPANPAA